MKQFRKLLTNGPFKQALVEFLFQEWQNCDPQILRGITVHLAHGAMCHSFTESEGHMYVNEVVELQCDHEEADSRLFLHAANVFLEHPKVEMRCSDTDVLVIAVSLQSKLSGKTFMLRGTASNRRLVNIAAIVDQLPCGIPEALIGLHVFTGCDSTSSFKGRGVVEECGLCVCLHRARESFGNWHQGRSQSWSISCVYCTDKTLAVSILLAIGFS